MIGDVYIQHLIIYDNEINDNDDNDGNVTTFKDPNIHAVERAVDKRR